MEFTLPKLDRTQWVITGLFVLVLAYIIFNELRKASWKKKLQADLDSIEKRMSSGRSTASELVDLNLKRKAILQQYLNTI